MAEITYLLGAGASCGALPVVSGMASKIEDAIKWLNSQYNEFSIINRYSTIDAQKFYTVIDDLERLRNICDTSKNFSVDTYARKINLSEKTDEYNKLRNLLSFYFTLEQRKSSPDIRYDNFWASILKSKLSFPDNIKIISWNYDFQLELTYQGFLDINSLKLSRKTLNVASLETTHFVDNAVSKFGIFKLNGSATFSSEHIKETNYFIDNFNELPLDQFIISLVNTYEKLNDSMRTISNHLSFAWEHKTDNSFYKQLYEAVKNTQILVVIGYSFPFFNRDIDKLIINEYMKSRLYKVYFQAPENDVQNIRERFLAINNRIDPINLLLRTDIQQFTLPNEL